METIKKIKIDYYAIGIFLASVLAIIAVYERLPDQIPMQYNFEMEVGKTWSKPVAVCFYVVITGLLALLSQLPSYIIKNERGAGKLKAVRFTMRASLTIVTIVFGAGLAMSMGYKFGSDLIVSLLTSIGMVVIGNRLPQLPRNRYLGFRLPWTIRDERTWRLTHRLMGYLSIPLAALQFVIYLFAGLKLSASTAILIWIGIGTVYSLGVFFKRKTYEGDDNE